MRAVIYARYSCDNQREESIEGQLRECKEYAEHKGFTVVDTYIDRAMSAKTDNRPEFQKMIKDSAKELFNAVIVWKLDRFARNRYDSAHYKAVLRKHGVKVVSATEVISEGAEGIILESVLEGYAEYYSAELSEKVIRGMTENALKCQYNGGYVPLGYTIDKNRHYQLDKLVAPLIKEAFIVYVNGRQIKDIVKFFADNGVLSSQKKPISKTTVTTLLQNRKYIGEYRYRDVVIPDGVPAIISKELFALAQQRLDKNRYAPSTYKADEGYLLTTKLICADCNSYMVGESGKGRTGKKYYYYKCANAKGKKGCTRKSLRKDDVEELVIDSAMKYVLQPDEIKLLAERVEAWQDKEDTVLPLLKKELADVEKGLSNVISAIEQGIINDSIKSRMNELSDIKKELEIKIVQTEIKSMRLSKEQIEFWLTNMASFDLANHDNKQRMVDTFINSIYVYDDRFVINFNCKEDSEKIPLCLSNSVSDLKAVGEPLKAHRLRIYGLSILYSEFSNIKNVSVS